MLHWSSATPQACTGAHVMRQPTLPASCIYSVVCHGLPVLPVRPSMRGSPLAGAMARKGHSCVLCEPVMLVAMLVAGKPTVVGELTVTAIGLNVSSPSSHQVSLSNRL